ncbi:MAG: hybrid sensor histidine kinase/response regulator, partial [Bacteroidales bacterium]
MERELDKRLLFEETSLTDKLFSILLLEDNPGDVILIKDLLKTTGIFFSLRHVSTLKETLMLCVEREFDVILLDLGLPDSVGLETLKKIQVFNMRSPVVVMTGLDDEDTALEAMREGAQDYLVKSRLTGDNILRGIKYGIERKKIQNILKKNATQFSILSSVTASVNECEEISPIFTLACRNISALLGKAGTVAFEADYPRKVHSAGLDTIQTWYDEITRITGLNLNNPAFIPDEHKKESLLLFSDGKLHRINAGFMEYQAKGHTPSANNESEAVSLFIYSIGFVRNEAIYGRLMIFSDNPIGDDDISIIEAVCNQVSLCLHRKAIEADLKVSELKYRKLSKELEMKVRERTRDLESANYQLNQELIERHMAEDALRQSEVRLRELNATKDKFFSIIAHDLKNPFTCLLGSTELLNDKIGQMDTDNIRSLVQILNDSAKSGYAILQNLLDWSRSQTGLISFMPEECDLKKLIDENIADLKLSSINKEIRLVSEVDEPLPVVADRNMINTVLRNLVGNAIKFTHRYGSVRVTATRDTNEVVVRVIDTGIGISEDNIDKLFRIDTKYMKPGTNKEQG